MGYGVPLLFFNHEEEEEEEEEEKREMRKKRRKIEPLPLDSLLPPAVVSRIWMKCKRERRLKAICLILTSPVENRVFCTSPLADDGTNSWFSSRQDTNEKINRGIS